MDTRRCLFSPTALIGRSSSADAAGRLVVVVAFGEALRDAVVATSVAVLLLLPSRMLSLPPKPLSCSLALSRCLASDPADHTPFASPFAVTRPESGLSNSPRDTTVGMAAASVGTGPARADFRAASWLRCRSSSSSVSLCCFSRNRCNACHAELPPLVVLPLYVDMPPLLSVAALFISRGHVHTPPPRPRWLKEDEDKPAGLEGKGRGKGVRIHRKKKRTGSAVGGRGEEARIQRKWRTAQL